MADSSTIRFLAGNATIRTPDTTSQRAAQFIEDELSKWGSVIRDADVKIS